MTGESLLDQFLAEGSMTRLVGQILDTIRHRAAGLVAFNSNIVDVDAGFNKGLVTITDDLDPSAEQVIG